MVSNPDEERESSVVAASGADDDDDDDASLVWSISSASEAAAFDDSIDLPSPVTFDNGLPLKTVHDTVLLKQAAEALRSALDLIDDARDNTKSWVDARDILDRTASALDDAGLALRSLPRSRSERSVTSRGSESDVASAGNSLGSIDSDKECKDGRDDRSSAAQDGALVRSLADEVINRRRALLGDVLVHDADGPWAKMEYGDGDGISFNDNSLSSIPNEYKEKKPLVTWASQTGTAKSFATRLHRLLGGDGRCVLKSMEKLTIEEVARYRRVYFVCSTFGYGRPPREGEMFYSMLQLGAMQYEENTDLCEHDGEEKALNGTSVAISALGSSKFTNFAKFGFGLAAELTALGAEMLFDVTTIDAKNGKKEQKEAFKEWAKRVAIVEKERLQKKRTKRISITMPKVEKESQRRWSRKSFSKMLPKMQPVRGAMSGDTKQQVNDATS